MLDPNSKSIFETETVDPNIVNKRKRTALMLCFTSPHFTEIARGFGLEMDPETGLAIPRAKRPDTAQVSVIAIFTKESIISECGFLLPLGRCWDSFRVASKAFGACYIRVDYKNKSVASPSVFFFRQRSSKLNGQTDQDWMKPGTRTDREEMVRILVEDLKADVKVLDMHDYRCIQREIISGRNT